MDDLAQISVSTGALNEARRKVDEVKARILKMGADPDEKGKGA